MKNISLPPNHRRSLASSLRIVEKLLDEMEKGLADPCGTGTILYRIDPDLSEADKKETLGQVRAAKSRIRELAAKYDLPSDSTELSRFINSHKSSIWVILSDSLSYKLKGFGEFPKDHAKEFDSDITRLLQIIGDI